MFTLSGSIKDALESVSVNVFFAYPASWSVLPCISWRECANREVSRCGGSVHLAEVQYAVDVWGASAKDVADLADDADAALSGMRLKRIYSADLYETTTRLHHRAMKYRAVIDASGNIYQ